MAVLGKAGVAFVFVRIIEEVSRSATTTVMRYVWSICLPVNEDSRRSGHSNGTARVLRDLELQFISTLELLEATRIKAALSGGYGSAWMHMRISFNGWSWYRIWVNSIV